MSLCHDYHLPPEARGAIFCRSRGSRIWTILGCPANTQSEFVDKRVWFLLWRQLFLSSLASEPLGTSPQCSHSGLSAVNTPANRDMMRGFWRDAVARGRGWMSARPVPSTPGASSVLTLGSLSFQRREHVCHADRDPAFHRGAFQLEGPVPEDGGQRNEPPSDPALHR